MKQYLDLVQKVLDEGRIKPGSREGMPETFGITGGDITMNMKDGFPLLTTKKMFWKGIIHELLWFLRGETNIKYLVDNKVNIWNQDAYRWYLKKYENKHGWPKSLIDNVVEYGDQNVPYTLEDFIVVIKSGDLSNTIAEDGYKLGDLGKVYGHQWRNQNGVDQISEVIDSLTNRPFERYHIVDGWNKSDFPEMALPPCHLLYQFIVTPMTSYEREDLYAKLNNYTQEERFEMNPGASDDDVNEIMDKHGIPRNMLDLKMYQRSVDVALGLPYNLASMSMILKMFAKIIGMAEGKAIWTGGDTHIYTDHFDMLNEQIKREPMELCDIKINKDIKTLDDILKLHIDDFELINYVSHDKLTAKLHTGLD